MIDLAEVYEVMSTIEEIGSDGPNHDAEDWPRCECGERVTAHWRKNQAGMKVNSISCGGCRYRIIADRDEVTDA